MNLYVSVFKNSKVVSVRRYGKAGPGPEGTVMTGAFQIEGQEFFVLNKGPQYKFTLQMDKIDIRKLKQAYDKAS